MSGEQYKEQFISEAKDHINSINDDLLAFEKDNSDEEVINNLFRSFHTLKGNSSTMGFIKFSETAHHLEDLLDNLRNKKIKADSDVVDILFKGVDCLEEGLAFISEGRSEEIDDSSLLDKIKEILSSAQSGQEEDEEKDEIKINFSQDELDYIEELKNQLNVFVITLEFDENNSLKGAKTLLTLKNLEQAGEIVKTFPSKDKITGAKFKKKTAIILSSDKEKTDIEKILETITGFNSYNISIFGESGNTNSDGDESSGESYSVGEENPKKSSEKSKEADKEKIAKQQQDAMSKQMQTVKIDIKSLDNLMDLVGELLISKVRLEQFAKNSSDKEFNSIVDNLTRLTVDIQDEVMKQRMIPIGNIFNRFPRMVRDLAKKESKEIDLVIEGQDIEFDRTVLDEIGDPLVHLLRNSVDHGIETIEERKKMGKNPSGKVNLIARKEKTNAIIEIIDDGAGIDGEKVKESCIKKGIISKEDADQLSEKELKRLIFSPGVSTNSNITEVSGRGVGMDVVETKIKNLGGNVKLESELGKGTSIKLQLPLTLAIVNSLIVLIDNSRYAIPLSTIVRTVKIKKKSIKTIQGNSVFLLMNEDIPMVWLSEILHGNPAKDLETYTVLVVDKEDNKIGIVVDSILSQQQVLIKSLDDMVKGIKGLGGATILGDGKVSMILDVATLFD